MQTKARQARVVSRAVAGVGAGAAVALALSAVVGVILGTSTLFGPSAEEQAVEVLRPGAATFAELAEGVDAAETVAELREAGVRADAELGALEQGAAQLRAIDDPDVRAVALRAHGDVLRAVGGWALLTDLSEEDLLPWTQTADGVLRATNDLRDGAAQQVAGLQSEAPVRLDHGLAREATLGAARYLRASERELQQWRRDVRAYRAELEEARAEGEDYRAAVRGQVAAYNETRDGLQEYVDDAQAFDEEIDLFRDELQEAQSARQEIRSQLGVLSSLAPRAVRDAHQRLELLLMTAVSATDVGVDLADETEELRDEGDPFTSGFDLPEYEEFVERSEQITRERDAAVSEWEAAVDRYLDRLGGDKPRRPAV